MGPSDETNHSVGWALEGTVSPEMAVSGLLQVIEAKDMRHTGTFWSWDGSVRHLLSEDTSSLTLH